MLFLVIIVLFHIYLLAVLCSSPFVCVLIPLSLVWIVVYLSSVVNKTKYIYCTGDQLWWWILSGSLPLYYIYFVPRAGAVALLIFSFLIHFSCIFSFRIAPLRFQTGCCRGRLNLDYSLFWVQFCVAVFLCLGYMILYVGICLILSCGVKVVSPCYRRWRNNLSESLDPFPVLGGCWTKRRPGLRLIYRWPSYTG